MLKIVEILQVQFLGMVVDAPVVVQRLVRWVWVLHRGASRGTQCHRTWRCGGDSACVGVESDVGLVPPFSDVIEALAVDRKLWSLMWVW